MKLKNLFRNFKSIVISNIFNYIPLIPDAKEMTNSRINANTDSTQKKNILCTFHFKPTFDKAKILGKGNVLPSKY